MGNEHAKEDYDKNNAEDIYNTLSSLKGAALKAAQMMSMDKTLLPEAYQKKFAEAQYKVPPLSYPLVRKTFKQYLGKYPEDFFETFTNKAVNAASIGQVHKATKNGQTFAVKIQYPGVGDSIHSDLALVKPIALRIMKLKAYEIEQYFKEVESKLKEETDYNLELKQGTEIARKCSGLKNLSFPEYFPEYSCEKIITMSWLPGKTIHEFLQDNPSKEIRNKVGQAIWDFYMYQFFNLNAVHADPHPGNFLVTENGKVGVIDFGCVKQVPKDVFDAYKNFFNYTFDTDEKLMYKTFVDLEFTLPNDTEQEKKYFFEIFKEIATLVSTPVRSKVFDFSNDVFINELGEFGKKFTTDKELKKSNYARGSKHLIYMNKTTFGLFFILNQIGAKVKTDW